MDYENQFYRTMLDNLEDGVYYVDYNRKILFWNKAAERISGYKRTEVEGENCFDNLLDHVDESGKKLCRTGCPLSRTLLDGITREEKFYLHHKEGQRVPIVTKVVPIKNPEGMTLGAVEIFTDNTEQTDISNKVKELAKLAYIDQETLLPNRNYLLMKWEFIHMEMNDSESVYGVMMLRITNFGMIVERYNKDIALRLLTISAKTLTNDSKPSFAIGRFEETILMVIIPNAHKEMIDMYKQRYCRLIERSFLNHQGKAVSIRLVSKSILSKKNESFEDVKKRLKEISYQ